jgi:hypothetical protein
MSYPVTFESDFAERRSRLTTFFRLILVIPLAIVLYFYAILALVVIVIAWFAIVFTARYPRGLYDFVAGYTRFSTRVLAYGALLCDPYPPFSGRDDAAYPVRMEFSELERYSRLKTFFRPILAIPIALLRYVMTLLLEITSIFAWFIIVIIGSLPSGLYEIMVLANSYIARSDAYLYLLTETYPPFQDEVTRGAGMAESPLTPSPSTGAPPSAGTSPPPAATPPSAPPGAAGEYSPPSTPE